MAVVAGHLKAGGESFQEGMHWKEGKVSNAVTHQWVQFFGFSMEPASWGGQVRLQCGPGPANRKSAWSRRSRLETHT